MFRENCLENIDEHFLVFTEAWEKRKYNLKIIAKNFGFKLNDILNKFKRFKFSSRLVFGRLKSLLIERS